MEKKFLFSLLVQQRRPVSSKEDQNVKKIEGDGSEVKAGGMRSAARGSHFGAQGWGGGAADSI